METTDNTQSFQNISHPILVLVRGIPGSGKSFLVSEVEKRIGSEHVTILDPDQIDLTSQAYADFSKALTDDGVDAKFHPYRWSRAKAYAGIESNKVVIWNQAFTNLDGFNKTIIN